jgi:preprotein translocase subunit SecA
VNVEDFKHKQREEIRELLVAQSRFCQQRADDYHEQVAARIDQLFGPDSEGQTAIIAAGGTEPLEQLVDWVDENLRGQLAVEDLERMQREDLLRKLTEVVEERFRPEMRRMERSILLQIVDTGWKDHLLAMDHLRSSVGLVGYAQVDPKVEYKREGMKIFEQMWESVGERVTDLIFRMEQLDEGFVGSTWVETSATHAQAESASEMARQQRDAIDASRGEVAVETIRNRGPARGTQRPLPLRQRQEIQELLHGKMVVAELTRPPGIERNEHHGGPCVIC